MTRSARGRTASGLAGLALAAVYLTWTLIDLPLGRRAEPGAAVFPLAVGILLAGASLALVIETRRDRSAAFGPGAPARGGGDRRRRLAAAGALIAYPLLLPFLGYLPATLLVSAALLRELGPARRGWGWAALGAAGLAIFAWGLFVGALGVPLPVSPLGGRP